jgi:hypothetical protein
MTAGNKTSNINVQISYRIIELFSQGLYRSPNKAIEELVSNSFDAGATKVHVVISPDLVLADATIAVIDNGVGMDEAGLRQHWRIGVSNKREGGKAFPRGRKQIGRFGIGKLATYVLANRLTHIAKCGGKFYATTMDYGEIPPASSDGIYAEKPVVLPLRQLTEEQTKAALALWLGKDKPGYQERAGTPAKGPVCIGGRRLHHARGVRSELPSAQVARGTVWAETWKRRGTAT